MAQTRVLACTAMSIHNSLLSRRTFDYCIIDEASQILQPVALGPWFVAKVW